MMDDVARFQPLLQKLMSGDNDTRKQAEEEFEKIEITNRASLLLQSAKRSEVTMENKQMALVLLRRLLSNSWEELWPQFTPDVQCAFKTELLVATQSEVDDGIRKKFCDVVSEVARYMIDDDGNQTWPEVLKFLFACGNSPSDAHKETALSIFESVPGIFGTQNHHYLQVIKDMLSASLQYQQNASVQLSALKAYTSFLSDNDEDTQLIRFFQDQVPQILTLCASVVEKDEDDSALHCLVDLSGTVPKLFKPRLHDLCMFCLKVLGNHDASDEMRHAALETMTTLCESSAPMMRKEGQKFISDLIQQCLGLMVDLEDDDDWATADEPEDDDADSGNAATGETSLDRISVGLGGKVVLPTCMQLLPTMLTNDNWKYRHAALLALSAIGEGCHKQMEHILESVVDAIIPLLGDAHPRVRYAACNAVGQMSTDFAPTLQKRFIAKILPPVLTVLGDYAHPRVQAHAAAALVNFSEDCPKNIITPYADQVMAHLEAVLNATFNELVQKGKKLVLEQVITTIASVADTLEEKFIAYYDRVLPPLKFILENANQKELRMLRGKTIECISLIGLAVGSEKFMGDANAVMQLLLKAQNEAGTADAMDDDDPQVSYMISAWARMCKVLGKQFEQYLPLVMPNVLKTASIKPEVAILESEDAKAVSEEEDWQFVNLGDQKSFGIRTAGLEDKATACQMLVCYAKELKEGFAPYVEEVTQLMVPLLRFYFHDGVRVAAAESLPYLLESAMIRGPQFVAQMWVYICPELIKAIDHDPDNDALSEHMWSLAKCIETLGAGCLTDEHFKELQEIIDKYLAQHFKKQQERQQKRQGEDYDEEVEKELIDEDDEDVFILSKLTDIMHALFSVYKDAILPFFDSLLAHFTELVRPGRPFADLQWGICIFDDVLEFCGPQSAKYQHIFLEPMMRALSSEHPEVRQASAYGFGIMATNGGTQYAQAVADAVPKLANIVQSPGARATEESSTATENAVAAVAKILKYNNSLVNATELLSHWLSWLPIWEDEDECPHVYGYLCDLIEMNHPVVLGDSNSNLPRIVFIIAEAFNKRAVESEGCSLVRQRLIAILRQIQSNNTAFQLCISQLTTEQQHAIQSALSAVDLH